MKAIRKSKTSPTKGPLSTLFNKQVNNLPADQLRSLIQTCQQRLKDFKSPRPVEARNTTSKVIDSRTLPLLEEGSHFLELMVIVLRSIYESPSITSEVYSNGLKAIERAYHHETKHHGITEGTKRFKEEVVYTINFIEGRNPDNLPLRATVKGSKLLVKFQELTPLVTSIQTKSEG